MTKAVTRRAFAGMALLAAASAALGATGCGRPQEPAADPEEGVPEELEPSTVHICHAGKPRVELASIYVARAKGYFEESKITVELVQTGNGASASEYVQDARVEYGIASQKELAGAFGGEEPYSILAVAALEQPETGEGYPLLLVANDSYLLHCADEAELVVDAMRRGCAYAAKEPEEAAKLIAEPLGMKADEAKAALVEALPRMVDASGAWGTIVQETWDGCFAQALAAGEIENKIPAHHGYSMDYLEGLDK